MTTRWFSMVTLALAFGACSNAGVIRYTDLTDAISITLDGTPITGNGGRISNFVINGENVSFDITAPGVLASPFTGFTNLLDPISDDPLNTVSDRIVISFTTPFQTYHVSIGSDPDLPVIPNGATDLTTVAPQGLPPNPYFEDGTSQKVATIFISTGAILDTYFIQSDVLGSGDVPEPSSILLIGTGLGLAALARRRLS